MFGGLRPGSEHTIKLEKECNGLTSCKSHNSNRVMATPIRPGIELAVAHLVHELGSDVSSEASSARPVRRSNFRAARGRHGDYGPTQVPRPTPLRPRTVVEWEPDSADVSEVKRFTSNGRAGELRRGEMLRRGVNRFGARPKQAP